MFKKMFDIYNYFESKAITTSHIKLTPAFYIKQRKNRSFIKGSKKYKTFVIGDIIEFLFIFKSVPLLYSGICIAIRRKSFLVPDVVLILRNVIMRVAIEVTVSFFYNRIYKLKFLDYKRKFYFYNKNKIFFIRKRLNKESRVGA
jgi:ribosomal protein L19